jgi:YD repeat-containing protein
MNATMTGVGDGRGGIRKWALCLSTILVSGLAAPAFAQTTPAPEAFRNADEHGVDLVTGSFNLKLIEGDIGHGEDKIALVRFLGQSGFTDNWDGALYQSNATTIIIRFGDTSEQFNKSGANWVAAKANGATLVENTTARLYTYRAADGTTITYKSPKQLARELSLNEATTTIQQCSASVNCALPTMITRPDGGQFVLTWDVTDADCLSTCSGNFFRLIDVRSKSSYALKFKYKTNVATTPPAPVPPVAWFERSNAKFFDLSQVFCDPAALDCDSVPGNWPSVTYSNPAPTVTQVTDERGGSWQITRGNAGRVSSIRRPGALNDTTLVNWGANGKVSSVTENGETKTYTWTGTTATNTVVATITGAGEAATVTSPLTTAQPTAIVNATSNSTQYVYDAFGRKTRETPPEGDYTNWIYDARGNVTETRNVAKAASGLADIVATANFDASCTVTVKCNKPNFVIDPKGNRTDYTYDPTHGELIRVQQPASIAGGTRPEVNYVYTALFPQVRNAANALVNAATPENKVTQITSCAILPTCGGGAAETKVTIAYATPNLLPSSVTTASGDGAISATTLYTYDAADNVKTVDGPLPGTDDTVTYFYDTANRRRGTIGPDPDGAAIRKRGGERLTYDSESRVTKIESGSANGVADADLTAMIVAQTVDILYDTNGNQLRETLSNAGTAFALTQYSYDVDNRLTCTAVRMNPAVYASLPADACTASTLNAANGPDRITKSIYDSNGRVTKVQTAFGTADQADEVTMLFTANSRTASVTDGEGNKTGYGFDGHDRIETTNYPDKVTKGLTSATDFEQLTYDANSNVIQRRVRDGALINYSYDNLDRLTLKDVPDTLSFVLDATYSYDLLGRLTGMTNPSGIPTSFSYDALGRTVSESTNGYTKSFSYDSGGRMTGMAYPGTPALTVTYDYDVTGNVTRVRENGATSGVGVLAAYAYDDLGRRTSLTRGNGTVTSYAFDPVSRLSSLSHDSLGTVEDVTTSFTYNPAGGIASSVRSNDIYRWNGHYNVDRPYTVNGLNQLTAAGTTALSYDGRGNLTGSGTVSYTYSTENRLVSAAKAGDPTAVLLYDLPGRLWQVTKAAAVIRFDYAGSALLMETDGAGAVLRRYVHGPGSDAPLIGTKAQASPTGASSMLTNVVALQRSPTEAAR